MGRSSGTLLASYLRGQVAALGAAEAALAAGEPDGVHDARVATRRLRVALGEFPRLLPLDDAAVTSARERLRAWGQDLAPARDLEVQLTALDAMPDVRDRAHAVLGPRLDAARRIAVAQLAKADHLRLRADLEALAATPPLTAKAGRRWHEELPRGLRRAERRVLRRERAALTVPPGPSGDEAQHDVRKAARRARYAAEVVAQGTGRRAREAAEVGERYRAMQDVLGAAHDEAVLRRTLIELRG